MSQWFSNRNIASIYIFIFITHIYLLEGLSGGLTIYAKMLLMALAPLIFVIRVPFISKAFIWGLLYFLYILFVGLYNYETFRLSTIIFAGALILVFTLIYNLIYCSAFTAGYYIRFLKFIIYTFTICLIAQQIFNIIGVGYFPPINKVYTLYERGVLAGNSLTLEPSHSARILAVVFLALLRMTELKIGRENMTLSKFYGDSKWAILSFLWTMLTMGSGTAFVALGILLLYFIKSQYVAIIVPLFAILYIAIPMIDYEPLNRAHNVIETAINGDADELRKTDGSAASRLNPLVNTIKYIDFSDPKHWFGEGVDAGNKYGVFSEKRMMGIITDYGLISFILGLILIFSCCITRIISIETLLIFMLVGFVVNNIVYIWGIYALLVPVKYFTLNNENNQ